MTFKQLHLKTYNNLISLLINNKITINHDTEEVYQEFIIEYKVVFEDHKKYEELFETLKMLLKIIKKETAKKGKFL